MHNRFSTTHNPSKHGIDHSIVVSKTCPYNAIPVWELLKMSETEYNAKYNSPVPISTPVPEIQHSSPK